MLKINKITTGDQEFTCGHINLILGSNNSGKSTFLKELYSAVSDTKLEESNLWIKKVELKGGTLKGDFDKLFPGILDYDDFNLTRYLTKEGMQSIYSIDGWDAFIFQELKKTGDKDIEFYIESPKINSNELRFYNFFCKLKSLIEECGERLKQGFSEIVDQIDSPYKGLIHYLYSNPDKFNKISSHIKEYFNGIQIVFDDLKQGQKEIRIKPKRKATKEEEGDLQKYSKYWKENSPLIKNQGDGIKAYLKICFSLFDQSKDMIFIDEPETFLHPPQRNSLGRFIRENADQGKQLFIATHDSEILRGILLKSSNPENIKIFHLENQKCKFLDFSSLQAKSRNYNEHILNAFFNRLNILCEAEDDRNIYQHASQNYLAKESSDIQFIGLNGKEETIKNFLLLNTLGLKKCCILDIDALYSREFLGLDLDQETRAKAEQLQKKLNLILKIGKKTTTKKYFKKTGLRDPQIASIKREIEDCCNLLENQGVFINRYGELESWFSIKNGTKKLQEAFNQIDSKTMRNLKFFLKKVINY